MRSRRTSPIAHARFPFKIAVMGACLALAVPGLAQQDPPADDVMPATGDDTFDDEEMEGEWEEGPGDEADEELEGSWEDGSSSDPGSGAADSGPAGTPSPEPGAQPAPETPTEPKAETEPGPGTPKEPAAAADPATPPPTDPEPTTDPEADPGIQIEGVSDDVEIATIGDEPEEPKRKKRRVGEPFPLTRREPLLGQWGVEVDIHYGLVGTGPTRLTNDIRFGLFDWWELRTTLSPYPASLMSRFKIGAQQGLLGALVVDGGIDGIDVGGRLIDDPDEPPVGPRLHLEAGMAYTRAIGPWLSFYGSARFRYRWSPILTNDIQNVLAVDAHLTYDILNNLAITVGLGYAEVVGTKVLELAVNTVEAGRPGISHFLIRDDGWSRSFTIPVALTYGRVDSFDVDVFVTPRLYPQFDLMFGAGIRWRIPELFNTRKSVEWLFAGGKRVFPAADTDYFNSSPE